MSDSMKYIRNGKVIAEIQNTGSATRLGPENDQTIPDPVGFLHSINIVDMKQVKRGSVVTLRSNARAVVYSVRWDFDNKAHLELGFVPGFLSRFPFNADGKCEHNDFFSIVYVSDHEFIELPPEVVPDKKSLWRFWE